MENCGEKDNVKNGFGHFTISRPYIFSAYEKYLIIRAAEQEKTPFERTLPWLSVGPDLFAKTIFGAARRIDGQNFRK